MKRRTDGPTDGRTEELAGLDRREAIGTMGAAVFGFSLGSPWRDAFAAARARGQAPTFFTDAERALVRVLADMIIPRDEKSGSATDSGAIEYMEFVLSESSDRVKQIWRDGIRWLDDESQRRFQAAFTAASETQRGEILDAIAFPARAAEALRPQVEFFNRARDLTASAFFSSRMGVEDLGYMGGVFNPDWQGAPPEALAPLGVSYEEWDRRYGPSVRRSVRPSPSRGNHE
jgi:gluconate 2-dehydrogenase gamma chain